MVVAAECLRANCGTQRRLRAQVNQRERTLAAENAASVPFASCVNWTVKFTQIHIGNERRQEIVVAVLLLARRLLIGSQLESS